MSKIKFEDHCYVTCTDSGIGHLAELHKFREKQYIEIIIQGIVVPMPFNNKGLYIGSKFGMEFVTPGPKSYTVNRR